MGSQVYEKRECASVSQCHGVTGMRVCMGQSVSCGHRYERVHGSVSVIMWSQVGERVCMGQSVSSCGSQVYGERECAWVSQCHHGVTGRRERVCMGQSVSWSVSVMWSQV
eukprot:TRINITY_DN19464_c0_g1_i4.p1 TRINITY_DN19464_c0_g1~~TRINITY_DN19464_c0_g1_i4.p1  ORF type:complete len:128 (-),score=21.15 TRINITY_DN19464_c0_g1_i4:141-470(-)